MRKFFTLITALTLALAAQAQQLPNNGFEEEWGDCTPWTGNGKPNKTKTGTQPANWNIAQVVGIGGLGATVVGLQTTGYNSEKAVLLTNTANSIKKEQIVPGYLTLGTPWNTSVMGNKNDGGTFGGITFDKRPDAVSFMYKRSQGKYPFSVVAYSWTGSTQQVEVPINIATGIFGNNPTKETMTDRDRNILGIETIYGGEITKSSNFKLISVINTQIEGTVDEWTSKTLEFKYSERNLVPEKFNIVFAAGNYFKNENEDKDNLTVDDVKLVYYSRLSDLTVGGKTIEGFSPDKYEYTITTDGDPDDLLFDIEAAVKGYAAQKQESGTADNYTIKVTNPDGEDIDGLSTHTYTIHVTKNAAPADGTKTVDGKLDVIMMGQELTKAQAAQVVIKPTAEANVVDFTLPNFSIALGGGDPTPLGDINVTGMKVYRDDANARTYYKGAVKGMSLAGGELIADVEAYGYITDAGIVNINIPVVWGDVDISVRFYSDGADLTEDPVVPETLISTAIASAPAVTVSPSAAYNAAGQRVSVASRGLRIVRTADGKVLKIMK